jgi:large subunit ribosomal protein L5
MANTRKAFYDKGRTELQKKLEKKNIHEVPMIEKIVVSMGIGSLATRKGVKDFAELETNMATITGQAPQMIMSKKSVSNFKLRE